MSNNARNLVRKQLPDSERLVTRGQIANLIDAINAGFTDHQYRLQVLEADRAQPWWRRFLGLRG